MTGFLQDSQRIIGSLALAVELHAPRQPIILYLARDGGTGMGWAGREREREKQEESEKGSKLWWQQQEGTGYRIILG